MDRFVFNLRREGLTAEEFRTEFDEIWSDLTQDQDAIRSLGLPLDIRGRPRSEYFAIEEAGPRAGLSEIQQVIVEALASGAASAAVQWILDRMSRGRPANTIEAVPRQQTGRPD